MKRPRLVSFLRSCKDALRVSAPRADISDPTLSCLAPSFLPSTAVLEVTYACNHVCRFCSCPWFAPGEALERLPELELRDWHEVISLLTRQGVSSLAFTGGEPLLKEGITDLLSFAAGCKVEHVETVAGGLVSRVAPPKLYLLTNGRLLTDDILELLHRHEVHLSLSLPGLDSFRWHTGGDETYVLGWLERAHAMGVGTTVGITVTRQNLPELYDTIARALLAGADSILLNRFLPGGRGLEQQQALSLNAEELHQMLETAESVLKEAGRYGSVGTELPKCVVDPARYEHLEVGTRCSAGLDFFVIDPSGFARVCNHSPVRLVHYKALETLKDHPYWRRFVLKEYLPEACRGCPSMTECDGGCREAAHIMGGAVDALDPLVAELMEATPGRFPV